jgi:hypothetical protein
MRKRMMIPVNQVPRPGQSRINHPNQSRTIQPTLLST